jgi:hypothetical protein
MAEAQAICEELGVDADIASTTGIPVIFQNHSPGWAGVFQKLSPT